MLTDERRSQELANKTVQQTLSETVFFDQPEEKTPELEQPQPAEPESPQMDSAQNKLPKPKLAEPKSADVPSVTVRVLPAGERLRKALYFHGLAIMLIPFAGLVAAAFLAVRHGVNRAEIIPFVVMYILGMIGLEIGYHRYFSHKSFQATPMLRAALAVLGGMSGQGPVIFWTSLHRYHHANSDERADIHSPYYSPDGALGSWSGLWHAHVGWHFNHPIPNATLYAQDLVSDPIMRTINKYHHAWILLGLIIPALMGWAIAGAPVGLLEGFLWGGLARIFLVNNSMYAVNSICHMFGSRPYETGDMSANNGWLCIPSFGLSWHNNHHAFPYSAILGLKWWQLDPAAWILRVFQKLGLVWDVKEPTPQAMAQAAKGVQNRVGSGSAGS